MTNTYSLLAINDLVLKKKILSLHEHYDVEDINGTKLGEAEGNLVQIPAKFTLKDTNNSELMHLGGKVLSIRDQFTLYDGSGAELGVIKKKIIKLIGREYWIEKNGVEVMRIFGNFTDHDYQMQINGAQVAMVHRRWFSVRDKIGVSITGMVDHRLVIGAVIVIEHLEVKEK
ncbi:MAG: LURP-one-related family protein [Methanomassiliicoccales archaeon]|nr:LURP-one-related family protein [Methanomassiliicoccales archaeon]